MVWNNNKKTSQKKTDTFKTIIVGDCDVGKSSIIRRFLHGNFTSKTDSTIGASFSCTRREEEDRYKKLDIWDTAGQERFRSIISIYYRGADVALLVCDLTKKDSIENLKYWISDLLERTDNPDVEVILVGNKTDVLKEQGEEIKAPKKLQELAIKYNYPIILTSALEGTNIEKMFNNILDKMDVPFTQRKEKCCENLQVSPSKKHGVWNNINGWCNVL